MNSPSFFHNVSYYIPNNNPKTRFDWFQDLYVDSHSEQLKLENEWITKYNLLREKQLSNTLSSSEYPVINENLFGKEETIKQLSVPEKLNNINQEIISHIVDKEIDTFITYLNDNKINIRNKEILIQDLRTYFYIFSG